jgi:hypothetical protein
MFECFSSQAKVLRGFDIAVERFRRAPRYDFTRPPHEGPLHYERLGWPLTGAAFRRAAAAARREMETP